MSIAKPILIFDGDCGFCRRSAARFLEMTQGRVEARPSQSLDLEALGVDPAAVKRAVVFVAPEGDPTEGSEAIFRALMHAPERRFRWGARMGLLPGVLPISQVGYRWVARNRGLAVRFERAFLRPVEALEERS